jgi:sortase A
MKRNILGTALIAVGVALLLGAAGLVGYNLCEEQTAGEISHSALQELTVQLPTEPAMAPTMPDETAPANPQLEIPDYLLNPNMELPVRESQGREYVGIVTIPALEVELPVLKEWSTKGAKVAPCRYKGTPYLDDLVICAHNYSTHFGRLNTLKTGDIVLFTDMDGNVFTYEVLAFEELRGNQVEELCVTDWDLTLFTCTIGGQSRFVVRCEKVRTLQ